MKGLIEYNFTFLDIRQCFVIERLNFCKFEPSQYFAIEMNLRQDSCYKIEFETRSLLLK